MFHLKIYETNAPKVMKKIYGYIRVSSKDQNEDRQMIAMKQKDIPLANIYMDKLSGKDFDRPQYQALMKKLKKGDCLILKSIDRLGRNYKDVMEQWRIVTKEIGADIIIIDMPLLDTTCSKDLLGTFISDIVLQLLSFVAENERENIHRRQAEGIAAAKLRGVKFGNNPIPLPENFPQLYTQWKEKKLEFDEFASSCNMAISTLYKKIALYRDATQSDFNETPF